MLVLLTALATPGKALAATNAKVNSRLTSRIISKANKKVNNSITTQPLEVNFVKQSLLKPDRTNKCIFEQDLFAVNLYKNIKSNLSLDFKVFRRAIGLRIIYAK